MGRKIYIQRAAFSDTYYLKEEVGGNDGKVLKDRGEFMGMDSLVDYLKSGDKYAVQLRNRRNVKFIINFSDKSDQSGATLEAELRKINFNRAFFSRLKSNSD